MEQNWDCWVCFSVPQWDIIVSVRLVHKTSIYILRKWRLNKQRQQEDFVHKTNVWSSPYKKNITQGQVSGHIHTNMRIRIEFNYFACQNTGTVPAQSAGQLKGDDGQAAADGTFHSWLAKWWCNISYNSSLQLNWSAITTHTDFKERFPYNSSLVSNYTSKQAFRLA